MMIINRLDSWAVDLKDIGAIYPMQGMEFIMAMIGIALWLFWHIWQLSSEQKKYREKANTHGTPENLKKAIEED